MNSSEYWARRFKRMEDALKDQAFEYAVNLEKQFEYAIRDLETKMRAWYQRFADNNKISLAEAKRLLKSDELKEFKWTVQEYIEKGKEMNLSGAWIRELENASARVHISRYDSMMYQLKHYAEMLTQKEVETTTDVSRLLYTESYYHTAYEVQKGLGIGWTMQALNENIINKVLSRPWAVDGKAFTARCWDNKEKLVNTLDIELTRMFSMGAAPDKAIEVIAKQFNTTKKNAGRVVMTESAFFASAAQRDCFNELGVEQYEVVCALDKFTCDFCCQMDGKVFRMCDYVPGSTAPPFHPWCRCCTAPYFEDMAGLGERYARDIETGKVYKVPSDMTYKQWKALQSKGPPGKFTVSDISKSVVLPKELTETNNISEDIKEAISKAIDKVSNSYDVDLSEIEYGPFRDNPKAPFTFIPYNKNGNYHAKLNINSLFDWNNSLDKFNERVYNRNYKKGVLASKNLEDLIYHEAAHFMTFSDCRTFSEFLDKEIEVRKQFVSGVSIYADYSEDGAEVIAEGFVRRKNNETISESVSKLLDKYIKEK